MRKKEVTQWRAGEGSQRKGVLGRFRLTFYSAAVLIVILILALNPGKDETSFLFDKNSPITLYVKTETGIMPAVDAALYFPEETDTSKFSYDWEGCDLRTPGTYAVPVFYDGKRTVCTISLEVLPQQESGTPFQGPEEKRDKTEFRNALRDDSMTEGGQK